MSKKNTCAKRVFAFLMAVLIAVTYMPTSLFAYAEDFVIEDQVTEDTSEDVVEPAQDDQTDPFENVDLGETVAQKEVTTPAEETPAADADTTVSDDTAVEEPAEDATETATDDQGETNDTDLSGLAERLDQEDLDVELPNDQATKEEPTEEPAAVLYPATTFKGEAGSVKVAVSAPEGALPEGTTMVVTPVSAKDVESKVAEVVNSDEIRSINAVDITFRDADGNEIEPLVPVTVTLKVSEMRGSASREIVHIDDEGEASLVDSVNVPNTGATLFESDQFSVYVVVGTGADARLKVRFVQADGTTVVEEMITPNQVSHINQYIYDPGVGTLPEGTIFEGWTTVQNYNASTPKKTIADVRNDVTAILNGGVTDGQEVTYYAMVFKPYTVTYVDEKSILVKTEQVLVRVNETAPTYTVSESYTPYPTGEAGVVAEFMGWQQIDPEVPGQMVLYQNGDELRLEATSYTLKAYTQKGHWLIFEENLTNATYTQPQFVAIGQTPTRPATNPTRTGYTFNNWYTEDADPNARDGRAAGSVFNFNQELTENTVVYGGWTGATQANYSVVIWFQNKEGTGYDYSGTTVTVRNATVGQNTYTISAQGTGNGRYARIYTSNNNYTNYNNFTGFHLSTVKPNSNGYDSPKPVAVEGNTVINVYYDRNQITYIFDDATYTYTPTTSNSGTQYGLVNGEYVELYRSGGNWYYNGNRYTGTRYTRSAADLTFTGLYGADFTEWPDPGNGKVWSRGTTSYPLPITEFNPAAVEENPDNTTTFTFTKTNFSEVHRLYVYKMTETGQWSYTNNYLIASAPLQSNGTWIPTETYIGYTLESYRLGSTNGQWTNCTPTTRISYNQDLYLRYTRNQYNIVYSDGVFVKGENEATVEGVTKRTNFDRENNVYYEANISGAQYNKTPEYSGFVFLGWYDNENCAGEPYTFNKMPAHNVTLYAKWGLSEYEINLHPNDSTSDPIQYNNPNQVATFYADEGDNIGNLGGERIYYELVGWYTDAAFTHAFDFQAIRINKTNIETYGHLYTADEMNPQYPTTIGKLDLYAKWRSKLVGAEGIQVEYDFNGGTGTTSDSHYYVDGAQALAGPACQPANPAEYAFSHWEVEHWNGTDYEPSGVNVFPGGTFNVLVADAKITDSNGNPVSASQLDSTKSYTYKVRLKAIYVEKDKEVKTHIYWYNNYDGGLVAQNNDIKINEAVDIPAAPSREGYVFKGWIRGIEEDGPTTTLTDLWLVYTGSGYTYNGAAATQVAADENLVGDGTQHHALYAKWEPIHYTVHFEPNPPQGTTASGTMQDQTFTYDEAQNLTANDFAVTNYNFLGWSTDPSATSPEYTDQQSVINLTAEDGATITLYAIWEKAVAPVTVHHYLKGTTTQVQADDTAEVNIGDQYTATPATTYEGLALTVDSYVPSQTIEVVDGENVITIYYTIEINITATTASKKYDGNPLNGGFTVTGALPDDEAAILASLGTAPSITNVSESPKTYTADVTGLPPYYTVGSNTSGTLTITPRYVTIQSPTKRKVYDGTPLQGGGTLMVTGDRFVGSEGFNWTFTGSRTDVGGEGLKENTFNYTLKANTDPENYVITTVYGDLIVTIADPFKLEVTPYNGVYDGQPHSITVVESSVPAGTTLYYTTENPDGANFDWENGWSTELPTFTNVNETVVTVYVMAENPNYEPSYAEATVTITPAPLTITTGGGEKVYDGTALTNSTVTIEGLVNGETATATTTGSQTEVGHSNNGYTLEWGTADPSNYTIVTENIGVLVVTKAKLVITADSNEKEYDGTPLTDNGWQDTPPAGLQGSDTVTSVTVTGSQTEVGSSANTPSGAVIMNGTTDVTANYDIQYVPGTLTVTTSSKELKITSESQTWVYDGTAHTYHTYKVTYGDESYTVTIADGETTGVATLNNGDTVTITPKSTATITHVAETPKDNDFDYVVSAPTHYSTVTKTVGTLSVTPATLTVTTNSGSKVYDGDPLTAPGTVTGFQNGETATFTVTGSQTEVGSSTNSYTLVFDQTAVASDYTISENLGTLTVSANATSITIVSATQSWTYDGSAHTEPVYTVTEGATTGTATLNTATGKYEYELSTGDVITITPAASATVTHVADGTVKNAFSYEVENAGYYTGITETEGDLKITPATLTVTTQSAQKEYDGEALTAPGEVTGFVNNETATFTVTGSQTLVGSSTNTYTLVFNGTAVQSDYTITSSLGTLTVTESTKELKVVSKDGEWVYDGTAHKKYEYIVTYGSETYNVTIAEGASTGSATLSTGDTIVISPLPTATITHVGESPVVNDFTYALTNSAQYSNQAKEEGDLTVTKATLTVTTGTDQKEYDGTALTATGSITGFVNEENADFTVTGSQKEVGSSTNTYTIVFKGEEGATEAATALRSDYTIVENLGTLTVTQSTKELKIVSADGEWTYDGNAHTKHEYTVTYGDATYTATISEGQTYTTVSLPTGDTVVITLADSATITHVAQNTVDNAFTYEVANADQFETITYEFGKLKINPATLTIVTESASREYNGQPLTANGSISGFVTPTGGEQETATFTVTGSQTEVGSSPNTYTIVWDGTAAEDDYVIDKTIGTLTVTASNKQLKVVSADGTWVYDGNAHYKHEYTVIYGDETKPVNLDRGTLTGSVTLSTGDTVTITAVEEDTTITHVAESPVTNAFSYTVTHSDQYANQTKEEGKLKVTPATLTIFTGTASREYTGYPLTSPGSIDGFVTPTGGVKETATFTVTGSQTEVGSSINTYTLVWDGTAIKSDYELDEDLGTLTVLISTEELNITSATNSWVYNGKAHTDYTYTVKYGEETYTVTVEEGATTAVATLSTGDTVTITPKSTATITHVAETTNDNDFDYVITHANQYQTVTKTVGKLSVTPATLTVTTESDSKVYDGTALTADGNVTGFQNGETATFTVTGSQTEVGSSTNSYTLVFDQTAVASDYTISEDLGTLVVSENKTAITIVSSTKSWVYDGDAHTEPVYTVTEGDRNGTATLNTETGKYEYTLSTGDVITITPSADATVTHVADGTVKNAFDYVLANAGNYTDVTKTEGDLSITPATLTITTESAEKPYDGTALTAGGQISGFVTPTGGEQETATFAVTGAQIVVGSSENSYSLVWDGTAVSTDYTLSENLGTLTVTASTKELKVVSKDGEWVYDGNDHIKHEYTVTYGDESYDVIIAEGETTGTATLSTGDVVTITPNEAAKIKHVAESDVDNAFDYTVDNSNQYANQVKEEGKLTVTKATLTIVTGSGEKEYDGQPLTADGSISGFVTPTGGTQETATFTVTGSQTEVGDSENTYTLVWNGTATESDYTLSENIGTLTVTASTKELKVVSADGQWVYDGNAHTKHEYTVTYGTETYTVTIADGAATGTATLSTGDVVTITPAGTATITHVAESDVTNAFTYTVENSGQYANKAKEEGKLTVTKATLTITTESGEKEYDGTALTANGSISGFVTPTGGTQETATFKVTGSQTEVGKSDNTYSITWDGTATESDYELSETIGELEVTASTKELKVVSADGEWVYDGNAHYKHEYTVIYGDETKPVNLDRGTLTGGVTLSTGDFVRITADEEATTITHVAESEVTNAFSYTVENSDMYANQKKEEGKLKVTPATLTVETLSATKAYDGTALTSGGSITGFVTPTGGEEETATFTVTGSQTEVGSSTNSYSIVWDGTATETDYTVSENLGTLTVTLDTTVLMITSGTQSWTYDGDAHTNNEYTVTYGNDNGTATLNDATGKYEYTLSTGDKITITPAATATITHVAESDVTNAFSFELEHASNYSNVSKTEGTLSVTPATLTITTESDEKEYDGTALTANGSISGFVTPTGGTQETATFAVTGAQIEVGQSNNTYTLVWDGTATESDYTLDPTIGTLTVTASTKELKVVSKDGEWVYDGDAHTKYEYTVTYGDESYDVTIAEGATTGTATLSTGDVVTITPAGTATITHVAESNVTNAFTYTVEHNDMYANQAKTEGKLKVTPATLTITTESGEKEYDGTALTANGSISGFVTPTGGTQETATFTVTGSQTEVGKSDNTYTITWDGTARESDYTLDPTLGTLTVTSSTKELKVVSKDGEWVYDGTSHTKHEYTVTYGTESYDVTIAEGASTGTATLSTGDVVTITPATAAKITHVAESDVDNAFSYTVEHSDQYANKTKTEGKLTVTPAPVTISTGSGEKPYDGTALLGSTALLDGSDVAAEITGLVAGETATVTATGSQTEVGSSQNTYSIVWGTATATDYAVTDNLGTLTITTNGAKVILTAPSDSKTYDGTALTCDGTGEKKVTASGLPDGFTWTATASGSQTDVGSSPNVVNDGYKFFDQNGDDKTSNFTNVTKVSGLLTVTPKDVTITANDANKPYDGTPLTEGGFTNTPLEPGDNHVFAVVMTEDSTITDVGTQPNVIATVDGIAVSADTATAVGNYMVTIVAGELEITQDTGAIVITSADNSWTYDSALHKDETYTVTYTGTEVAADSTGKVFTLPNGDVITITATAAGVTNVSDNAPNNNTYTYTVTRGTVDTSGNYESITANVGTLTINPKAVTITADNANKPYDGTPLTEGGFTNTPLETGDNHVFEVVMTEDSTITDVGTQPNVIATVDGIAVTTGQQTAVGNYLVTTATGTLTITKDEAEIIITSADHTWTYDGQNHTDETYTVSYKGTELTADSTGKVFTLPNNDVLTITATAAGVTNVSDNAADNNTYTFVIKRGETVTTGYYENIVTNVGDLVIAPKEVTITAKDASKPYDGTPLTEGGFQTTALEPGDNHVFVVTMTADSTITDVGTQPNVIATVDGTAVTTGQQVAIGNYLVTTVNGELEITHDTAQIVITSSSNEWTYDGQTHTDETYTVTYNGVVIEPEEDGVTFILPNGDVITITPTAEGVTNVSDNEEDNNTFTYTVARGDVDTSGNYENLNTDPGTLKINPRPVTVTADPKTKVYGTADPELTATEENLVEGESLDYEIYRDPGENVGSYNISFEFVADQQPAPVGFFKRLMRAFQPKTQTAIMGNYEVQFVDGEFDITKKPLTITAASDTKVYDGTPLTNSNYTYTELAEGDTLKSVTVTGSQTEVGSSPNVPSNAVIVNAQDEDMTGNYEITYESGALVVTAPEVEPPKPPKTGDENQPWKWAALATLAISALGVLMASRKREEEAE